MSRMRVRAANGTCVSRACALVGVGLLSALLVSAGPARMGAGHDGTSHDVHYIVQFDPALLIDDVGRRLSDPAMEGRGAGTAGIDSAAALIASWMRADGLTPGDDDGTYYQPFRITTGVRLGEPCAIEIDTFSAGPGDDFQPIGFSTNGTLEAPVVFAGYGITAPGLDYDDYAGIDAAGKIVLILSQEPGEMDTTSRFNGDINTAHAELRTKAINAREHGALGMIVADGPLYHRGDPLPVPKAGSTGYMTSGLLAARASERVANAILSADAVTLETLQRAIDAHGRPHSLDLEAKTRLTVTLERTRADIRNVVGWIRGRDTTRTIVLGAHYDHLGYGGEGSLAPDSHAVHPGADDNASGVTALLALSHWFAGLLELPAHNLVFCAFAGEESGLLGSDHFADQPTRPIESVEAMINMDMVGRLKDRKLIVMGAGTAAEFKTLLANVNVAEGLDLKTTDDGFGPSDHTSFYKRHVPVLCMFTGVHEDYHKPSDTWDKINVGGIAKIADFVAAIVESLDARPRVTYVEASAAPMGAIGGGAGYGAYLGTIPDYVKTEGGVLLSGVRAGGPADVAGIRGGDTVVKFDGVRIDNIYDYTYALRSRKPGQQVRITVLRDGAELDLLVTLGRRGESPAPTDPHPKPDPRSGTGGHP
jgi:Peptidase family M28/PDZ domain/PA domain